MTICHGLDHLDTEVSRISFTVGLLFTNSIKEITSRHEFHHNKIAVLFVKEIDQRNDVSVLDGSQNGDFIVNGSIV
jgi:hypothetical protein